MAVYEFGSRYVNPTNGAALRSVQCVARGTWAEAHSTAWAMYNALNQANEEVILNSNTYLIKLQQIPFKFKKDELKRTYFAFNLIMSTPV